MTRCAECVPIRRCAYAASPAAGRRAGAPVRSASPVPAPHPAPPFVRFVLRRLAALVLLCIGITLVVVHAHAARAEQRGGDQPRRAGRRPIPRPSRRSRSTTASTSRCPSSTGSTSRTSLQGDLGESLADAPARSRTTSRRSSPRPPSSRCLGRHRRRLRDPFGVIAAMRRNRPTDHALRVVSLGGISMPTFWIALVALYVFFFRLGWFPGGDRLDPGVLAAAAQDRAATRSTRCSPASGRRRRDALHHLMLPGARARGVQRQPADALHALGRARGDRQRLRARRAREGAAGAGRASRATSCAPRCRRS